MSGQNKDENGNSVDHDYSQVVDIRTGVRCTKPPAGVPYPHITSGIVGTKITDIPLFCGGSKSYPSGTPSADKLQLNQCYTFNKSSNSYEFLTNMNHRRSLAGSTLFDGKLWITGMIVIIPI